MPLISVIIPVYNGSLFLEKCVESVLSIQSSELECILVNDGSTDNSAEICDNLAKSNSQIKVIHQKNNGVSSARNNGINHASGKYIYFLDSDDICLLKNIDFLGTDKDFYAGEYAVGNENKYNIVSYPNKIYDSYAVAYLKEQVKYCIGSFIVKREIIINNSITFPEKIKYGEDQEFIIKSLTNSNSIYCSNLLFCLYRTNLNSAMYKISLNRFDVAISRIRMLAYYKDTDTVLYNYLKNYAITDAIITVCEGLFRFGMPFTNVWTYLKNNIEIQNYIVALKSDKSQNNANHKIICSPISLKLLQFRVITDYKIYKLRCIASKFKNKIISHRLKS